MTLLKTVHLLASSLGVKPVCCGPVNVISRVLGVVVIVLSSAAPPVGAQQSRAPAGPATKEGLMRFEPPAMLPDLPSGESAAEADSHRDRRVRWLKSANGSLSIESETARGKETGRMGGLSREERHRLRSDIREAGFTVYSPGPGQGLAPAQPELGAPGNFPPGSRR